MSSARPPRVEFLWWEECPSWERALEMLRGIMAEGGMDPNTVELRKVGTEANAEGEAFVGSPTIRVEGKDIQPPGSDERFGLSCRVYRRRDGSTSPLPDPKDIREALARAERSLKQEAMG